MRLSAVYGGAYTAALALGRCTIVTLRNSVPPSLVTTLQGGVVGVKTF